MSKKKNKKINKISKIIYLIFLLISSITLGIVFYLKVLPVKYSSVIFLIYAFLNLFFAFFLLRKK